MKDCPVSQSEVSVNHAVQQQAHQSTLTAPAHHPVSGTLMNVKPRLRGRLHSYASVAVLAAGLILILEAPGTRATVAATVYVCAAFFQFTISGVYHSGNWQPNTHKLLMRLDHSAIYSLIAGTYTPFILLPFAHTEMASRLLVRIWIAALCGVGKTWLWPHAPKYFNAMIYVVMGWSALPYQGLLIEAVGLPVVTLVALGGVLYSIGAFVYAMRWPDPFPRWFGFHEVFHTLVILASICHFAGMYRVVVKMNFVTPVVA